MDAQNLHLLCFNLTLVLVPKALLHGCHVNDVNIFLLNHVL